MLSMILTASGAFLAGCILTLCVHRAYTNKKIDEYNQLYQKILLSSFDLFTPHMEIVFSFFVSMDDFNKSRSDDAELSGQFAELKRDIAGIRRTILTTQKRVKRLKSEDFLNLKKMTEVLLALEKLKQNLYSTSVHVILTINEFSGRFMRDEKLIEQTNTTMAEIIYYLSSIVPILSDFSSTSNEISKQIIITLIQKFEVISNFSNKITGDIQITMTDLMSEERNDSLAFVVKRTKEVIEEFETFFGDMRELKTISNEFVDKSVEKLKGIADIAASIEDIAETIKVISLNVSVEAANTGNVAKGFQVLARDLREFALKTTRFAQDVKSRVKDAMQTTETLKVDYVKRMEEVYDYVVGIKDSLESFGTIINESFIKITGVIETLRSFSGKIEDGIKDVIGQLQYYDIRSQEVEHIGIFIENILLKFSSNMDAMKIETILSEEHKKEIRKNILESIEAFITTSSERKILEKYEKLYEIRVSTLSYMEGEKEDDNIIVF